MSILYFILHAWYAVSGANNEPGPVYGSWSGIAGATACFSFIPASYYVIRKHNCHIHRCWRVGRYQIAGGNYTSCRKHHPEENVRNGLRPHHIHEAHRRHVERNAEQGS